MKKFLVLLLFMLCIAGIAACISGCKEKHTHSFDRQVTNEEYLASPVTCTERAKYYFSCECGEKGPTTFYGAYGNHTYSNVWSKNEKKHWHSSTCRHAVRIDENSHSFVNNICTVCKYDISTITLNKTTVSLHVGETLKLIATILPENVTDKKILWESSSSGVATVDDGTVTAITKGTTKITATVGESSATCSVEVEEEFTFVPFGNNYSVSAYVGNKNKVEVPAKYNGKPVTIIGSRSFYDCSQITEIVLPDTIKEIGTQAFGYCTSLAKIEIAACARVADHAFVGCTSLTEIYFPDGLVAVGVNPFEKCTSLTKVVMESGTITSSVFWGNKYIKEIILGSGVTEIAQNAFKGCSSLENLTVPSVNENKEFIDYYLGVTTSKYTLRGSGWDNLYPEDQEGYEVIAPNGVTHIFFNLPKDGSKWYYIDEGVSIDGLYYEYRNEPITVSSWQDFYEITVDVWYKKPKAWSANFYYIPDISLKTLTITDQLISVYDDVFTGLHCTLDIKHRFPVESVVLVGDKDVYIDEFDLKDYKLKVTYTDGFSETFPFDSKYLQSDVNDLKTAGKKTLSINYDGVDYEFDLNIKLHLFSEASMDDLIAIVDGLPKNLTVKGVPEGTMVAYKNNGQTKVGEYVVTATLTKQYYETKILTANLKIRQEKYNIFYEFDTDIIKNDNPNEYYYGTPLSLNTPVSKSGVFIAWYTDPKFYNKFGEITSTTYGDITLYAKWILYYNVTGNCITGLTETAKELKELNIPTKINGTTITSIGDSAFSGCSGLETIEVASENTVYHSSNNCLIETATGTLILGCKNSVIPNNGSVTSIGKYAFSGCSGLTSITIPDSVTSIGDFAFRSCSNLQYNIYDYAKYLGNSNNPYLVLVKAKDTNISSCKINESTRIICSSAFENCSGLTSITIPDSVTSIGGYAFYSCSGLTSVTIPDSVTSIGSSAFVGCSSLKFNEYDNGYYLGNNNNLYLVLIKAKDRNISSCKINESTRIICGYAFENCSGLTSITISDGVTSIWDGAFNGCSGLTNVTIPDSVTSIGSAAFYGCSRLTSITIPDSVTSIGDCVLLLQRAYKHCF